jgi:glycosyltransferase involved in cell wall biosynthesis
MKRGGSKLSVIIPLYNEESTIREIVEKVQQVTLPIEKEIIVVDDGSTDDSVPILRKLIKGKGYRNILLVSKKNQGKGSAVRHGLRKAQGNIVLIQDADLEYSPTDYPALVTPILEGRAKVVYGSRFIGERHKEILLHYFGNKFLSWTISLLYSARITDMETCYKAFSSDVINGMKIRSNRFEFEPEITSKLLKAGHEIHEVPIKYTARSWNEGKKITWLDGLRAFYSILKFRFIE